MSAPCTKDVVLARSAKEDECAVCYAWHSCNYCLPVAMLGMFLQERLAGRWTLWSVLGSSGTSGWKRLTCSSGVQIAAVKTALGNVPEETRGNVEKKQARTYEELQAEQAEQEQARPCPFLCLVKSTEGLGALPAGCDTAQEQGIPASWMPCKCKRHSGHST